jgi:N-acetylglutamate synthase-like GNAT family acetyltransferase
MIDLLPVRPVAPRDPDWRTFSELLALASLPQPGEDGRSFAVEDERGLLGFGALEGEGPDQLLRSVVLVPSLRRRGLGHALVSRLVGQARTDGAERLWLLATGAERWFARLGWSPVPRAGAPEAIRRLGQLQGVCPASAALMVRALA